MSQPRAVPVTSFRHDTDPDVIRDPWSTWTRLRREHDIFRSDQGAGHGVVYLMGYEAQHTALRDPATFSSCSVSPDFRTAGSTDDSPLAGGFKLIPVQLDPPEHTKYRQILQPLFTPMKALELEERARSRCRELIDEFAPIGEVELMSQFARRFPTTIFMEQMGLPVESADVFLGWIDDLMHASSDIEATPDERVARSNAAATAVFEYLGGLVDERKAEPRQDFVSYLLAATIEGRPLDRQELMQICFMLYMAGLDTVAGTIGYCFQHLALHDADRQRIVDDPTAIPATVEELLRHYSVVTTIREVTRDTRFNGCPLQAGDRVVFPTSSANRDPNEFEDAESFDIDRDSNRHIAFGAGPHRCIGSHLARLELRVALEEWHQRIPHYRIVDPDALRHHVLSVSGLHELPLVFDAATQGAPSRSPAHGDRGHA